MRTPIFFLFIVSLLNIKTLDHQFLREASAEADQKKKLEDNVNPKVYQVAEKPVFVLRRAQHERKLSNNFKLSFVRPELVEG